MQAQLNNNFNIFTKILSNKIVYSFKIKKILSLLYSDNSTQNNIVNKRLKYCAKVANAILFANIKTKIYYNTRYMLLILRLDDCVYLRLNYSYYLFDRSSKKMLLQRCDLFLIKKRIDCLAYFLKLLLY